VLNGESGGDVGCAVRVGALAGDDIWNNSLSELEFHSNTEADPVLDVGEFVRLSTGTRTWGFVGIKPFRRCALLRGIESAMSVATLWIQVSRLL
jgi:hypothetical protein